MMKALKIAVFFSVLFFVAGQGFANPLGLKKLWQTPNALSVPESVMYDADKQILYVSNIAGKPTEKNAKGFIAQVDLDGRIKKLHWVTGMNAPKGMGIFKGTLYVTDIDRIHAINIATGKIKKSWDVEGAKFLNDIAIDALGKVFITDMNANRLYAIENGQVALFAELKQSNPNGLLMQGQTLLMGTAEGLFRVDMETRAVTLMIENKGGIDGLKHLDGGRYIVSDWYGKTQVIEQGKAPEVLIDTTDNKINAADIEFIAEKQLLLIPTFFDNRVMAYQIVNNAGSK